jgi:hypothetical protein
MKNTDGTILMPSVQIGYFGFSFSVGKPTHFRKAV